MDDRDRDNVFSESIVTIEVILQTTNIKFKTHYENDYVLEEENFEAYLELLLNTKGILIDCENVQAYLDRQNQKKKNLKKKHIYNIENYKKKKRWIHGHENHHLFSLTDTVICPACGGMMYLKKYLGCDYDYTNPKHPVQKLIKNKQEELSEYKSNLYTRCQ